MVFRRENRDTRNADTFNRQVEALRQPAPAGQGDEAPDEFEDRAYPYDLDAPDEPAAEAPARTQAAQGGTSTYPAYARPETPTYSAPSGTTPMAYTSDQPTSVIAADTIWRGDLESNGDVHVHGQVQGTITARTDIFVSEDADADATLVANTVVVAGNVKGVIRATTRLEVLPQGRITGEVIAPTLVAHDGARVNATVRMTLTAEEQAGTPPRVSTTQRRPGRTAARY